MRKLKGRKREKVKLRTMVRTDEGLVKKAIVSVLEDMEEIAGAFLFGSALGPCRPDSLEGHPFQIVPLNITNCIFAFNVIKHGRLIYERDHETITNSIEILSRRYGENYFFKVS